MSLADAVRIIAHRSEFPDLGVALMLVGVTLDAPAASAMVDMPFTAPVPVFLEEWLPDPGAAEGWSDEDVLLADGETSESATALQASRGGDDPDRTAGKGRHEGSGEGLSLPRSSGVIASVREPEPGIRPVPTPSQQVLTYRPVPGPVWAHSAKGSAADVIFNIRTLGSTLHSMVRVLKESREPDLDAVVAKIATAEPVDRVPMIRRRGQPDKIRLLCDLELRSGPYRGDVRFLVHLARRLFGDDRIELLAFRRSPDWGCGAGPVWTWLPHADWPRAEATMVIGYGTPTRNSDPDYLRSFALRCVNEGHEVCVVLIGAEPSVPPARAYPQLLIKD